MSETSPTPSEALDSFAQSPNETEASSYFAAVPAESLPLFLPDEWTLMPLVDACDNYELPHGPFDESCAPLPDGLVPFFHRADDRRQPIGFLLPAVVEALVADNTACARMHMAECWQVLRRPDDSVWALAIAPSLLDEGFHAICEHFDRLTRTWKQTGLFASELDGWRDEQYTIYGPVPLPRKGAAQPSPLPGTNAIFRIERSAAALFSFLTFGVHMTGYTVDARGTYSLWVPRRSPTKATFPGLLDQTVAGGLTAGLTPFETLVKEAGEEASLPADFVERHARAAGVISYVRRSASGFIQPEVQYCYDLRFPPDAPTPRVNDGEVESFALMTDREALDAARAGKWKPNCAAVLIDMLVRHGRITPESDTRYLDLCTRLRRTLPLPSPA